MSFELDSRVGSTERQQFATQTPPEYCQVLLNSGFHGDESPDFYEGLLSGCSISLAIMQQMPIENAKIVIGSIVAHTASHLL